MGKEKVRTWENRNIPAKKEKNIPDYPIDRGNKKKIHDENKNHVTQHDSQNFCMVPIDDFPKNHVFGHDLED